MLLLLLKKKQMWLNLLVLKLGGNVNNIIYLVFECNFVLQITFQIIKYIAVVFHLLWSCHIYAYLFSFILRFTLLLLLRRVIISFCFFFVFVSLLSFMRKSLRLCVFFKFINSWMEQEQATHEMENYIIHINANNGRISMNNQSSACSSSNNNNNTIDSVDMHLSKRCQQVKPNWNQASSTLSVWQILYAMLYNKMKTPRLFVYLQTQFNVYIVFIQLKYKLYICK